jgi:hypothetical protein
MKIEQATSYTITELWANVEPRVQQSNYLEEASQELASALRTLFDESVVIARVFLTVPFDALPTTNKEFVQRLAESAGAEPELKATTPVLSLLGTSGQAAEWNDRHKSKGHMGIPLISSDFVEAIPMISRLLEDLGVPMGWADSHDTEIIRKKMDPSSGLFFVENAAEATDHQGRKIIAAQDFVSSFNVKSVFGAGGTYAGDQVLVIVVFCRDVLPRSIAEHFLELMDSFISKTSYLFGTTKIFSEG